MTGRVRTAMWQESLLEAQEPYELDDVRDASATLMAMECEPEIATGS